MKPRRRRPPGRAETSASNAARWSARNPIPTGIKAESRSTLAIICSFDAVPPHVHHDEDELSYVLDGTFGVRVGDKVAEAGPGSYIFKPRNVPQTFWNAGPGPARLIEVIQPAGFEDFFEKLGEAAQMASSPDEFDATRTRLGAEYNLAFVPEWIEELKARYGLKLLGEP